jgi:hypothetical protein
LIGNSSLYTHIPKIKSISQIIVEKKWWQLNIWANFKVQRAISWPKIIQPEQISKLICNLWLYSHTKNQVNISNHSEIKWWQLNIWPNFIRPERNVNLICNLSLYTHIPNIKSISRSIAEKSGDHCFISELQNDGHG